MTAVLRQLALDWLQGALAECKQQVAANPGKADEVRARMLHWQTDTDLIAVRDAPALARLPVNQYQEWQQLWADVNALRH